MRCRRYRRIRCADIYIVSRNRSFNSTKDRVRYIRDERRSIKQRLRQLMDPSLQAMLQDSLISFERELRVLRQALRVPVGAVLVVDLEHSLDDMRDCSARDLDLWNIVRDIVAKEICLEQRQPKPVEVADQMIPCDLRAFIDLWR